MGWHRFTNLRRSADRGAAAAEFVLIAALLVFLLFAVVQVALYFYIRNIVASSATDGARYAANVGVDPQAGAARASTLVRQGLSAGVARDVPCVGSSGVDGATGLSLSVVRCVGKVKSAFLPIGALITVDVKSRSLNEGPS